MVMSSTFALFTGPSSCTRDWWFRTETGHGVAARSAGPQTSHHTHDRCAIAGSVLEVEATYVVNVCHCLFLC